MDGQVLTVSQLNQYLKSVIDSDVALRHLTVKGEVSNFTNHRSSGHFYFSIKDATGSMRVVMFKTYASQVRFEVENGMSVVITGSIRLFERDGAIQLYAQELQPDGIGALALAYEQLKERLDREGLFEPQWKKPIPTFPQTIGVITSKTGAALQDIYNILSRRYPIGRLLLIPALVQGELAPKSICQAIALANEVGNIDVLIVGRGGGSIEDLWAFNNESVARAIFQSDIPVISAVGHEIDFTIADFVSDLRAPTPSAAAELATPDCQDLLQRIAATKNYLWQLANGHLRGYEEKIDVLNKRLQVVSPQKMVVKEQEKLLGLQQHLTRVMTQKLEKQQELFLKQAALLEALNPLKVLTRGYTITYLQDKVLQEDTKVQVGDVLKTTLQTMCISSRVEIIERKGNDDGGKIF